MPIRVRQGVLGIFGYRSNGGGMEIKYVFRFNYAVHGAGTDSSSGRRGRWGWGWGGLCDGGGIGSCKGSETGLGVGECGPREEEDGEVNEIGIGLVGEFGPEGEGEFGLEGTEGCGDGVVGLVK
ncbi:ctenidin-3-like [Helianthus annuus]|uniref:ctenidin-3-like n=1 Tax=Helianthus annuus TaxID=4232 RepID=UPI000B8FAC03|nr:ctenidin-3-like [Helianthus annuus]